MDGGKLKVNEVAKFNTNIQYVNFMKIYRIRAVQPNDDKSCIVNYAISQFIMG